MSTHTSHNTFLGRTALALLLALITTATARADEREGYWYYRNLNDHAVITGWNALTNITVITIPETLGGLPVTGFEGFTFEGFTKLGRYGSPPTRTSPRFPPTLRGGSQTSE